MQNIHSEFKSIHIRTENGKTSKSVYNMKKDGDKFSENYKEYTDDKLINEFRSDNSAKSLINDVDLRKEIMINPSQISIPRRILPLPFLDISKELRELEDEYENKLRQLNKEKRNRISF